MRSSPAVAETAPGPLLVVVATEAERAALDAHPAMRGRLEALVCGVGKIAAALAVSARLRSGPVRAVVSFGIAGAYPGTGLEVGDVVVATETAAIDEGLLTPQGFRPFAMPGMPVTGASWRPCDPEIVERLVSAPPPGFAVRSGRIATVSVCAGTSPLAEERSRSGALAESMEGAAAAEASALAGVPFAEIRGISNPCGPRDGAPFELPRAAANAATILRRLLA